MNLIGQFILHSLYGVTIYFTDPAQNQYINSKWISPVTEDCYDTLCFNSERTVLFYSCKEDFHAELGYNVKDGIIEVEAYGQSDMNPKSKLILKEDQGILRQLSTQQNSFPLNFIKIPEGKCE